MAIEKNYNFEVIFENEESDIYSAKGINSFDAIKNFLHSSKGAIDNDIVSINLLYLKRYKGEK